MQALIAAVTTQIQALLTGFTGPLGLALGTAALAMAVIGYLWLHWPASWCFTAGLGALALFTIGAIGSGLHG